MTKSRNRRFREIGVLNAESAESAFWAPNPRIRRLKRRIRGFGASIAMTKSRNRRIRGFGDMSRRFRGIGVTVHDKIEETPNPRIRWSSGCQNREIVLQIAKTTESAIRIWQLLLPSSYIATWNTYCKYVSQIYTGSGINITNIYDKGANIYGLGYAYCKYVCQIYRAGEYILEICTTNIYAAGE